MTEDEYVITGHEVVEKQAKPHGNGARVIIPKDWAGETVKVVKTTNQEKQVDNIKPVAALMHDSTENENKTLQQSMQKVIRFKSFNEIDPEIVQDFQQAVNSHDTEQTLRQIAENTEDQQLKKFYQEICSSKPLGQTTEKWTR